MRNFGTAWNAAIEAIVIHGGEQTTHEHGIHRVPKRELVSVTQAALQTDHLKIAADLPEANVLVTELQNFQVEISQAGFDSYNARSGSHDDLTLSVSMALWLGQRPEWKFSRLGF